MSVFVLLPFPVATQAYIRCPIAAVTLHNLGGGAWIAHQRRFLQGADWLFGELRRKIQWKAKERMMYQRRVDVPRLLGPHPEQPPAILGDIGRQLSARFSVDFDRRSAALYRDGNDSVAWHGDRLGELKKNSVVALVSLGGTRRFLTRPAGGGPSTRYTLGSGDLMLMGGAIHLTHEHCIPKMAQAQPRIVVMYRHSNTLPAQGAA